MSLMALVSFDSSTTKPVMVVMVVVGLTGHSCMSKRDCAVSDEVRSTLTGT